MVLGCRCILDADGERLALGLEAHPYLIKPNRFELETMLGRELRSLADIRDAARTCIDRGASVVAVSLGADGAMIVDGDEALYAPRMAVDVKSTVGAGDTMVAGFACGIIGDSTLEEMLRMGVAAATARCATDVSRVVDRALYSDLLAGSPSSGSERRAPFGARASCIAAVERFRCAAHTLV